MKWDNLRLNVRKKLVVSAALAASILIAMVTDVIAAGLPTSQVNKTGLAVTDDTVKVGILHSITGTMAISETGSVEAEKLAIEQINAMGGILGRKIEIIQEDGASDWPTFAEKAKKLLERDKVAAVFGCWTSASRKAGSPWRTPGRPSCCHGEPRNSARTTQRPLKVPPF